MRSYISTPNYDEKWVSENKAKITKMFSEHMEKSM